MVQRVDFNKLDTVALKRYRRFHKLDDVGPNPTKEELVSAVGKHFTAQVPCICLEHATALIVSSQHSHVLHSRQQRCCSHVTYRNVVCSLCPFSAFLFAQA